MKIPIRRLFPLPWLCAGFGLVLAGAAMAQTFTTLHHFTALASSTNSDGANPNASLILLDNTLYGTAEHGGNGGHGTVFRVNLDGTGFTNLHSFTAFRLSTTNVGGATPFVSVLATPSSRRCRGRGRMWAQCKPNQVPDSIERAQKRRRS